MSTQTALPATFPSLGRGECPASGLPTGVPALAQWVRVLMSLPFDALRAQYALAVRTGIVERSMLAAGRFEQALAALEQLSYGPFARRV